ncbi:MAG: type 1 glutamine amidotransferase [Candidatus Omnitrophica bacterium]|nr:type 1 glutamine amidotransferase [Candidatus Omnitrophota bacterium]
MILIVKHIDIEGPGTLGDFLKARKEPFQIIELGEGERIPPDPRVFSGVVVLGGPMNVYEEDIYPFLKEENNFIQNVLNDGVPFLGICLGAQLLAKAAGALVVRSPVKEIGWYHITLTPEGKTDPLFAGFCPQDPVYQWHGDMFQIPLGGKLLAVAEGCPHQAIKVGSNAYGLQFHIEITDKSIQEWGEKYCQTDLPGRLDHAKVMVDDYYKYRHVFTNQAQRLYQNLLEIIHANHSPCTN